MSETKSIYAGWTQPTKIVSTTLGEPYTFDLPTIEQLTNLRDKHLEHGNKEIAAAIDNVLDLISIRVAELRSAEMDEYAKDWQQQVTELRGG